MESNKSLQLPTLVFIIFLILKLTNNIDWSWWWVTSPLWLPVAIAVSIIFLIIFVVVVLLAFGVPMSEIEKKVKDFKKK